MTGADGNKFIQREDGGVEQRLTPIPWRIHCGATSEFGGTEPELDDLAIDHFLSILADIVLSVAGKRES